jgi:hypothetical protein
VAVTRDENSSGNVNSESEDSIDYSDVMSRHFDARCRKKLRVKDLCESSGSFKMMEQEKKLTYVCFVCCIDDELRPERGGEGRGTCGDAKDGKTRKRPREAEGRWKMFVMT